MKRSLFENPKAFSPIYDDVVAVEGVRAGHVARGQFRACVLDQGLADPLGDADASTTRRAVSVLIPRTGGCAWIGGRPQVGDVVTVPALGLRFKVSGVSMSMGDDWEMEARQA